MADDLVGLPPTEVFHTQSNREPIVNISGNISMTAHYTAQAWVCQGLPWARHFDTAQGRFYRRLLAPVWALGRRMGHTTPQEFLVQRHCIMDALLRRISPIQVVELAAGLSPRCLAFAQEDGILRCIDADLPEMVATKRSLLPARLPPGYRQAALDLLGRDDYVAQLDRVYLRDAPAVVLTEGILTYFSPEQVAQVLARVAGLLRACGGGTYLTELHHGDQVDAMLLGRAFRFCLHRLTGVPLRPLVRNRVQAESMFRQAGFDEVKVHHPRDWAAELALPIQPIDSGLRVYEAIMAPRGRHGSSRRR